MHQTLQTRGALAAPPRVKGGRSRSQTVPEQLRVHLDNYIRSRPAPLDPPSPLFPGRTPGAALCGRESDVRFKLWKERAGLSRRLTIHSFRAGLATLLHQATGDPFLVASALGHRNLATTRRYVAREDDLVRSVVEAVLGPMLPQAR